MIIDGKSNNTYILSLLERGRLEFLAHNWSASQQTFAQAYTFEFRPPAGS